ncbi:MAG: glycerophosphodiester phosphodiesterase family protein, partial [Bacteroidota bacterium]
MAIIFCMIAISWRYLPFTFLLLVCCTIISCTTSNNRASGLPELYNDNSDHFVVIAHRGASAYAPENTMAAFRIAVDMNAEMIELDVLLSGDGVPVAIHEDQLDRTTDTTGLTSQFTLETLQSVDAGSWFSADFAGEPVPTLDEVLRYCSGKISVNIEIKHEAVTNDVEGGIEEKVINLVKRYGMEHHVII